MYVYHFGRTDTSVQQYIFSNYRYFLVLTNVNEKVEAAQMELRRFIAYTEIFLMPIVIWMTLSYGTHILNNAHSVLSLCVL